jgi:hypothetical protein
VFYTRDLSVFWTTVTVFFVITIMGIIFWWICKLMMWQRRNMAENFDIYVSFAPPRALVSTFVPVPVNRLRGAGKMKVRRAISNTSHNT